MSYKIMIGTVNQLENMTVTSTHSADAAHPLSNLTNGIKDIPTRWDVSSTTSFAIKGTSATAVNVNALMIKGHNFTGSATVRLRLYSGENQTGTLLFDSTSKVPLTNRAFGELIAGVHKIDGYLELENRLDPVYTLTFDTALIKSFQIDIDATGSPDDVLRIDTVALFFGWSPDYNFSYGYDQGIQEDAEHEQSRGGGLHTFAMPARRSLRVEFELMETLNNNTFLDLMSAIGMGGNVYIIPNPSATGYTKYLGNSIYKRNSQATRRARFFNGNSSTLVLEEN
ncbi:hypothetical protein [Pseudohongiella sp. O18]|uniref:hypothetical protein n=1 Tax=Pseudohongiella sp. O18 TaxID=2904248 RepID=UPI001F276846|nr:hypothetical protein [Pseudohongiella sp. O18]